jgi:hypothetical protein
LSGLSYQDRRVAIPVFTLLASHSPFEAKNSLAFAEAAWQAPVDVTAASALA